MELPERINAFSRLGQTLADFSIAESENLCQQALLGNPWFTQDNVTLALKGVRFMLAERSLRSWTASYRLAPVSIRTVGVAMAGNIPLVGFHDLLCVLISGHRLKAKLSSRDAVLMKYLAKHLTVIEPRFAELIQFDDRLNSVDAVIATGGNNTSRYFEYYFRNVPHIIRKNRASCAVIRGAESIEQLRELGVDVFSYFGLGCRSVSKLFVPAGYDMQQLFSAWSSFGVIIDHSKYRNNYDYQKTLLLMNSISYLDNGFVLLREDPSFVSPVSVVNFEFYDDEHELALRLADDREKIQCAVSSDRWFPESHDFGKAQFPAVVDYADNVDTLLFLERL